MRAHGKRWTGAVVVAALVALAWGQWRSDQADAPGTLLTMAPDQVQRIDIVHTGAPPQHYQRQDGHWLQTGTDTPDAERDGRLDRIAAIAAAPVERWRPVGALDLHTLGLRPPRLTLYLNGQRLDYGVMTPFAPTRYVRVGDRVAVIPAQFTPQAPVARRITLPDANEPRRQAQPGSSSQSRGRR